MNIKCAKFYICPETGNMFATEKEATESALRFKEEQEKKQKQKLKAEEELRNRENLVNYTRLNLTNIYDLGKMINKKAKEFWGLDLDINIHIGGFGKVSCSHAAPIGKKTNWGGRDRNLPTSYLGWNGKIEGTLKNFKRKGAFYERATSDMSVRDIIQSCFKGIYCGSGSCGGIEKRIGEINMDCQMFLMDFPLLQEAYENFAKNSEREYDYENKIMRRNTDAQIYIGLQEDVKARQKLLDKIKKCYDRKSDEQKKIINEYIKQYEEQHPVDLPEMIGSYEDQIKMFNGASYI